MHGDKPSRKPVHIWPETYCGGVERGGMTVKAGYSQRLHTSDSRLCNRTHSVIERALCDEQGQLTSAGWETTSAHSYANSLSPDIYRQICDCIGGAQ